MKEKEIGVGSVLVKIRKHKVNNQIPIKAGWELQGGFLDYGESYSGVAELPVEVDRVISSNPATVVCWTDKTKTVVKCSKDDKFDKEKGFLMAYFLKHSGKTTTAAAKFLDSIQPEEDVKKTKKQKAKKVVKKTVKKVVKNEKNN